MIGKQLKSYKRMSYFSLSDSAQSEINAVQDMKNDRTIILELTKAISTGHATGTIGNRDTSTIDLVTLDTAIAHALKLGCRTREAKRILQNARLIRQIRLAWRVMNTMEFPICSLF